MSFGKYNPLPPVSIFPGEIEGYDFVRTAEQAFYALQTLHAVNLLYSNPYDGPEDVIAVIRRLIDDIDLGSELHQTSECKHLRIEYQDELLTIEVFLGI